MLPNQNPATRTQKLPENIWFLGIGGIGMSALARWFRAGGHRVGGYDRTPTPLTKALEAEGITVIFDEAVAALPTWVSADPAAVLIVRTPAVPTGHAQWQYFQTQGYAIRKRSEVLGMLTAGTRLIAVAGTHGKTTTSSMVAHLLHHAGVPVAAFLGGIATNFSSNLLLPTGAAEAASGPSGNSPLLTVVEADEYDRSFLTLYPTVAIVTSTDADHLDIYGDKAALLDSFRDFVGQIQPYGLLLLNYTADERVLAKLDPTVQVIRYGLVGGVAEDADADARALRVAGRTFTFDFSSPFGRVAALELRVPGFHNVENMVAALTVAQHAGVGEEHLRAAVPAYAGVKRRFEFVYEDARTVYVDDYAHHPREIDAFLRSLRALYPDRRLTVVFQPHLFSRTRDFATGSGESLSLADEVVLLPIYPAREEPMLGVTSALIFAAVTAPTKVLLAHKQDLLEFLATAAGRPAVLATVGAGDIDTLVEPVRQWLANST
ncbi:MAG: UDP-N-acetylmuramate--L-alanine ligase [Hymenobacteraceae bacterium]|nr:UDP-N-acetylmuramate--L-alanine ligase [Hymenobacteraceae bacterium]